MDTKRGKTDREEEEMRRKGNGDFLVFRWSNLDGLRVKVDPCNEGYAWVPKFGSFVKLQEV